MSVAEGGAARARRTVAAGIECRYAPRTMEGLRIALTIAAGWLVVVLLAHGLVVPWLRRGPAHDPVFGILWRTVRLYCRRWQRARWTGEAALRERIDIGPLVVVSNHTGAVDPFLIQAGCRFRIRWMMATDQMAPTLDPLWQVTQVIPVARDGTDSAPARTAIRHVRDGGCVGIFPEGRIVTPPRRLWPFLAGVGLIVARTQAPVLLVWIRGTPDTNSMTRSFTGRGRAQVTYLERIEYDEWCDAKSITEDLRARLHAVSGWPYEDDPPPPERPGTLEPLNPSPDTIPA